MADLLAEKLISLAAAARLIPGWRGAPTANPSTVYRWCMTGTVRPDGVRVFLEHARVGGRVLTSVEAVTRYIEALTARPEVAEAPRSPAKRDRETARTGEELSATGW